MCSTCGCGDAETVRHVGLEESLLAHNEAAAEHNRRHFRAAGVRVINLMGGPGSGKTALIEATARAWPGRLTALSGDLATDRDAERLRAAGVTARTITTGQGCHLDAAQVHEALHELDWRASEILFIENVGNLVCPALFDLGQEVNVVTLSVTEGADKPLKYPVMFRDADLVVLTKLDLLPHLGGVQLADFIESLESTMRHPRWIALSSHQGEGVESWLEWLDAKLMSSVGVARAEIHDERDY